MDHVEGSHYRDIRSGSVYLVLREFEGFQHIKCGFAEDVPRRQDDYDKRCVDVPFDWKFSWEVPDVRRVGKSIVICLWIYFQHSSERLVHITFRLLGEVAVCVPCPGCGVKHKEFYTMDNIPTIERGVEIFEFCIVVAREELKR